MLTKVYIDNFKSLVNFEFKPGPLQLILGDNGAGKSSFFDAMWRLREFLIKGVSASLVFRGSTLTRWDDRPKQVFELTVERDGRDYVYRVEIEQFRDSRSAKVALETLHFEGKPLFSFIQGEVQRYRDDHSEGPKFSSEWYRSALSSVPPQDDSEKLTWFKQWMNSLCLAAVEPQMEIESIDEVSEPDLVLNRFASWYRHLISVDPTAVWELNDVLKTGVIEGFEALVLRKEGERAQRLSIELKAGSVGDGSGTIRYDDWELSDGQRVLIKLYALAFCAMKPDRTLILDDPVVHVSLREIQPWLLTLLDRADDIKAQVLLISHHPELINYLARENGVFFDREGNGPVRVRPAQFDEDEPLPPAELVARGWTDG